MNNIQYLACGYDLMQGNPLPTIGTPVDPGYKDEIFALTYKKHSISADGNFLQPDHTMIKGAKGTCTLTAQTHIIAGKKEYEENLSHHVGVDFKGWGAKFSMSYDYKKVVERTEKYKDKYTITDTMCLTYIASLYGGDDAMQLNERFISNVKKLPSDYEGNEREYERFVEHFGTHYITDMSMGSLLSMQTRLSESSWNKLNQEGNNVKVAAGYSFLKLFKVNFDYNFDQEETETEEFEESLEEKLQITLGKPPPADGDDATWREAVVQDPAPIKNNLSPISDLLDESFYGMQFKSDDFSMEDLKKRQDNLRIYYIHYCESNPIGIDCTKYDVDPTHECPDGYYEVDNDLAGSDEEIIRDPVEDLNACSKVCDKRFGCVAFEYDWVRQKCATYTSKKLGVKENRNDRVSRMKSCIMSISYAGHEAIKRSSTDKNDDMQFVSHYEFPHDGKLKYWEFYSNWSGKELLLQVCDYRMGEKYECSQGTEVHNTKMGKNVVEANLNVKKGQIIGWWSPNRQPIVFQEENCQSKVRRRYGRLKKDQVTRIGTQWPRCYSIRAVVQDKEGRERAIDRYTRVVAHYEELGLSSRCRSLGCSTMDREEGSEQCAELCSDNGECTVFQYTPDGTRGDAYRCCLRACKRGMSDLRLGPDRKTWDIYVPTDVVKGELHLALGDRQDGVCLRATDGKDQNSHDKWYRGSKYDTMEKCYNFCKGRDLVACEFTRKNECITFEENVGSASGDERYKCWIMGQTQYYTSNDPEERCVTHDIRTASQCEEAAYWIGGDWKGAGSWSDSPTGCIVNTKGRKYVRWNRNCADSSHKDRGVVCRSKADRSYDLNPEWDYNCNLEGLPQAEEPKCESCDEEAIRNPNQCWFQCGKTAGYCSACDSKQGTKGACCRLNSDGSKSTRDGCDAVSEEAFPFRNFHTCVLVPSSRCTPDQEELSQVFWGTTSCQEIQDNWNVCNLENDPNHNDVMQRCPATCANARQESCPESPTENSDEVDPSSLEAMSLSLSDGIGGYEVFEYGFAVVGLLALAYTVRGVFRQKDYVTIEEESEI